VPDHQSMLMLEELGYSQSDSRIALQITRNDAERALVYLVNNPLPLQFPNENDPVPELSEIE